VSYLFWDFETNKKFNLGFIYNKYFLKNALLSRYFVSKLWPNIFAQLGYRIYRIPRFYFLEYLFQMCSFDVSFFLYHLQFGAFSCQKTCRKTDSENYITGAFFVVVRSRTVREPSFEGFGFESNKICSWTFVQKFSLIRK